jgi:hypothetical protein
MSYSERLQAYWKPRAADIVKVLAEDLSRAFREEYRTAARGRRYRAKHPIRTTKNGAQLFLWDDMATASRDHLERAFAWRRQQIVGDCHQLKIDVDVYHEQNPTAEPIQLILDFNNDVRELEMDCEGKDAA